MKIQSRRRFLNSLLITTGMMLFRNATGAAYSFDEGMLRWSTMEASELEGLIGQSFTIYGVDTKSFTDGVDTSCAMTLESVYVGKLDPGRPTFLSRKQSFIALFIPTWGYNCISNDQIVKISHPGVIGEENIFLTSKTDKYDKPFLEVVFN